MGFFGNVWDTLWSIDPIFSVIIYVIVHFILVYCHSTLMAIIGACVGFIVGSLLYAGMYYWRAKRLNKPLKDTIGFLALLKYGFSTALPIVGYAILSIICMTNVAYLPIISFVCLIGSKVFGSIIWGLLNYYLIYAPIFYQALVGNKK